MKLDQEHFDACSKLVAEFGDQFLQLLTSANQESRCSLGAYLAGPLSGPRNIDAELLSDFLLSIEIDSLMKRLVILTLEMRDQKPSTELQTSMMQELAAVVTRFSGDCAYACVMEIDNNE